MKIIFISLLLVCGMTEMSAQISLQTNGIRVGDEIIKQQVEYVDPGRSGENVIWNFGKLRSIDDKYTLTYSSPPILDDSIYVAGQDRFLVKNIKAGELIVGHEHNTRYYYRLRNDSLLVIGYENPVNLVSYNKPFLLLTYPFTYGQKLASPYSLKGVYSGSNVITASGSLDTQIDAYGMMVLPSGDTLKHVIRTKSIQSFDELEKGILERDNQPRLITEVETYRWYAKGYRYPVFETIRTIDKHTSTQVFATAFFFPPKDHYYLSSDSENLAILDSLWNTGLHNVTDPDISHQNVVKEEFSYNFYPNPVESKLHVEYYLQNAMTAEIALYSIDGRLIQRIAQKQQNWGIHLETIDCTRLEKGNYILRLRLGENNVSEKIIKR